MSFFSLLPKSRRSQNSESKAGQQALPGPGRIVESSYSSHPVDIQDILLSPLPSLPTCTKIDFSQTPLSEYIGHNAYILDGVLTTEECQQLIVMAEQSTSSEPLIPFSPESAKAWKPALVNVGGNMEIQSFGYRNSDRIIWDSPEVVERLWKRCKLVGGLDELQAVDSNPILMSKRDMSLGKQWNFTRLNERMRFLRYGVGQFFRGSFILTGFSILTPSLFTNYILEHCDASYRVPYSEPEERTLYTLQLYLNDSVEGLKNTWTLNGPAVYHLPSAAGESNKELSKDLLQGGATSFHSNDLRHRISVHPKVGRVLIFQHRGLLHSGDDVESGQKYNMRTELMFRVVPDEEKE
jgi:hypothetical protein